MHRKNTMTSFFDSKDIPSFGVAGNFTGHLEQAGEAKDFLKIKTEDVNAPKAIFPTYIPLTNAKQTPQYLCTFPFDQEKIIFPPEVADASEEQKLQIEPECAIIFNAKWKDEQLVELNPVCFGASNDCSIRKEGAKKISMKKNWGSASKGFSKDTIPLQTFSSAPIDKNILNNYRIASFLVRDGKTYQYGEDSAIRDYSYIYEKLVEWMIQKFNNQIDEGPAENIHSYLVEAGCPKQIMVSIGATRYTAWGESNFLQAGDEAVVILYPENKYSFEKIQQTLGTGLSEVSVLRQKIIL